MFYHWVCKTLKLSIYLICLLSLQPDGVLLWHFKHRLYDITEFIDWYIYLRSATLCCKDIGIRKWDSSFFTLRPLKLWNRKTIFHAHWPFRSINIAMQSFHIPQLYVFQCIVYILKKDLTRIFESLYLCNTIL